MAETVTDVLVAGYQEIEQATRDFESLVGLERDKQVSIEMVWSRTPATQCLGTADGHNLIARGWVRAAGVGLAAGLFAPLVRPMTTRLSPGPTHRGDEVTEPRTSQSNDGRASRGSGCPGRIGR